MLVAVVVPACAGADVGGTDVYEDGGRWVLVVSGGGIGGHDGGDGWMRTVA